MDLAIDKFDKERFGTITGSACSVMFPERGDGKVGMKTYAKKLANQMFFNYYDEVSTWQMQHGSLCEHEAFEFFKTNLDFEIEKGHFKRVEDWSGTCDALCKDYGVDFKCPTSLENWLDYLYFGIDKQQYNQAQMYMFLFDKPMWKICAYLTETEWMNDRDLSYPVPQEKRMICTVVEKNPTWKVDLEISTSFVIRERNNFLEELKKQFN